LDSFLSSINRGKKAKKSLFLVWHAVICVL
jgi:hypothetical protein